MVTNAKTISNDTYYKYFTSVQVEEGDTLYSLAEEYGDYFESDKAFINEVKYANHLIEDTIYAGSYLVVPYYSTEYRWFPWIMLSVVAFDNNCSYTWLYAVNSDPSD